MTLPPGVIPERCDAPSVGPVPVSPIRSRKLVVWCPEAEDYSRSLLFEARKAMGLSAGETIMVGDTMETDILGGVQLGFDAVELLEERGLGLGAHDACDLLAGLEALDDRHPVLAGLPGLDEAPLGHELALARSGRRDGLAGAARRAHRAAVQCPGAGRCAGETRRG